MLRLHFVTRGVELSDLTSSVIPLVRFLMEIQTMKRLLVVTAVVMLSASTMGCGCWPRGYMWRRAMCSDPCAPGVGAAVVPGVTYGDPYVSYGDPYLAPPPAIETVPGPVIE